MKEPVGNVTWIHSLSLPSRMALYHVGSHVLNKTALANATYTCLYDPPPPLCPQITEHNRLATSSFLMST